MRVTLAFATEKSTLRAFLTGQRENVVPREIGFKGYYCQKGASFSIQVIEINQRTQISHVHDWLINIRKKSDGLILFVDDEHRCLTECLEEAYFIVPLNRQVGHVMQNYVRATVTQALRHFAAYSRKFDDMRSMRVLLLPFTSFIANELSALRAHMTTAKMERGLVNDLENMIAEVNKRARPKSKVRGRDVYLVDDRPLYFRYGHEEHKFVEVTHPPHDLKCDHNSQFRFGRRYNARRHFNVDNDAKDTAVCGKFVTCHGESYVANGESHLGIFPNGFI